jgi:hypothetical protein
MMETAPRSTSVPLAHGAASHRFVRPNRSAVPDVPQTPRVRRDAAAGLAAGHNAQGLHIDAWTATPLWRGERLDLNLALQALMPPRP